MSGYIRDKLLHYLEGQKGVVSRKIMQCTDIKALENLFTNNKITNINIGDSITRLNKKPNDNLTRWRITYGIDYEGSERVLNFLFSPRSPESFFEKDLGLPEDVKTTIEISNNRISFLREIDCTEDSTTIEQNLGLINTNNQLFLTNLKAYIVEKNSQIDNYNNSLEQMIKDRRDKINLLETAFS